MTLKVEEPPTARLDIVALAGCVQCHMLAQEFLHVGDVEVLVSYQRGVGTWRSWGAGTVSFGGRICDGEGKCGMCEASFDLPTVGWKVIVMRNSYSVVSTVHWVASVFCRSVLPLLVQKLPCRALSSHVVLKDCPVIIGLSDAKRDSYNLFGLESSLRELRDAPGNRRAWTLNGEPGRVVGTANFFAFTA